MSRPMLRWIVQSAVFVLHEVLEVASIAAYERLDRWQSEQETPLESALRRREYREVVAARRGL